MSLADLLLVAVAFGAGSFAKGAIGLGLPTLALPLLADRFGLPHAIVVAAIPILVSNLWQIAEHRAAWPDMGFLRRAVPAGLIGLVAGTFVMSRISPAVANMILGAMLLVYVGTRFLPGAGRGTPARLAGADWGAGLASGLLQGASGMSSPPLIALLHARRLSRSGFILGMSVLLGIYALFQSVTLVATGLAGRAALLHGCLALVPMAAMMPVGARMGRRFGAALFDRIITGLVLVLGLHLLLRGAGVY